MFVWGGCEDLWGRARGGGGGGVDGHAGEEEGDDGSLVAFQKGEITVVWVYDERWESGRNCWGFVVASMGMVRVGVGWVVEGWKGRLGGGGGGGGCGRERGLRRFGGAKGVLFGGGGCLDYEGMVVDDALPIVITDKTLASRNLTDNVYKYKYTHIEHQTFNADASYAYQ